jgi:hypothetical protein
LKLDILRDKLSGQKSEIAYISASIIIFALFVFPLIYIGGFVQLYSDDFCTSLLSTGFSSENLIHWYTTINGRYINAVLSSLPVYDLPVYRIVASLNVVVFAGALFIFITSLCNIFKLQVSVSKVLFLSVIFFAFQVASLPSVFELLYWYSSASVHLYGFIFFLFFVVLSLKIYLKNKWNLFPASFMVVFINGNNELFLGSTNFVLILLLLLEFLNTKNINFKLLVLNIISWVSSLVIVLSPGTETRRSQYDYGGDILVSAKVAILYGGKFIVENMMSWTAIVFFLAFFLFKSRQLQEKRRIKNIPVIPLFIVSFLVFISLYFIKFYATGIVERDRGRVGDLLHLVLYSVAIVNIINLAIYYSGSNTQRIFKFPLLPAVFFMFLLTGIAMFNSNYQDIRFDIVSGDLHRFESEFEEREIILSSSGENNPVINKIESTRILKSGDKLLLAEDWGWLRGCYSDYLNKLNNTNIDSIKIIKSQ